MDKITELGIKRQNIHKGHSTPRFFNNPYIEDIIGVAGETQFGKEFNLPVDESIKAEGDKGYDFKYKTLTIDVKTARKPIHLLLKEKDKDKCADILVLAKYNIDNSVTLIGWCTRNMILSTPTRDFGYGIINFYLHHSALFPIETLKTVFVNNLKDIANETP
jgi:hypothetical protein